MAVGCPSTTYSCGKIPRHVSVRVESVVLAPLIPCAKILKTIGDMHYEVVLAPLIPCAKIR